MNRLILPLVLVLASLAQADIIPTLNPSSPTALPSGGFAWSYTANVTVDEVVMQGDFFTIYDFGTFVNGSNRQPTGWAFSSALVGLTPSQVLPTDDPNKANLTWTYTNELPINGTALLGSFAVVAATDQLRKSDFAARATRNSGPNVGSKIDNIGQTVVPVPEMNPILPVLAVCAAAVMTTHVKSRRSRRQQRAKVEIPFV